LSIRKTQGALRETQRRTIESLLAGNRPDLVRLPEAKLRRIDQQEEQALADLDARSRAGLALTPLAVLAVEVTR
jgi:hypothetical protein